MIVQSTQAQQYRPDIDGLRAIAVLAVILFHFNAAWLPGGFAGVDVFFVISGYLITGLLLKEMDKGTFSLAEFYRRRIRRIGPAMLTVIAVTLVAAQFILHPADLEELAVSAFSALLFLPNVYATFELDTGYFAQASEVQPLLHLWTLGVEEQFYLFWPLVLMALASIRFKPVFWVLVALLGIGGATLLAELVLQGNPEFAYYMLPTRAGQLLVGALCAYWAFGGSAWLKQRWVPWLTVPGLALIIASYGLLAPEGNYPGLLSVPVTVGTGLVILAGVHRMGLVSRLLGVKPLVGVGLISYSLYLWHWPVLALARYREQTLTPTVMVGLAVVIALASWASYRYIEQPFRRSDRPFKSLAWRQWVLPSAGILAACLFLYSTEGVGLYAFNSEYRQHYEMLGGGQDPASRANYVCQHGTVNQKEMTERRCLINTMEEPDVLLWGDSNAAHYVGAFKILGEAVGFGFRNIAHSACPPLVENAERYTSEQWKERCAQASRFVADNLEPYDTIILATSWDTAMNLGEDFSAAFEATLKTLAQQGKTVYVVGRVPRLDPDFQSCSIKQLKGVTCELDNTVRAQRAADTNRKIQAIAQQNGAKYLDFNATLCADGQCSPYIDEQFVYFDGGHISRTGSEILGKAAKRNEGVIDTLAPLAGAQGPLDASGITWKVENLIDYMPSEEYEPYFDPSRHLVVEDRDSDGYTNVRISILELVPHFYMPEETGLALKLSIKHAENHPLLRLYVNRTLPSEVRYDYVYHADTKTISSPALARTLVREPGDTGETQVTLVTPPLKGLKALELRIYGGAETQDGGYSTSAEGIIAVEQISVGVADSQPVAQTEK